MLIRKRPAVRHREPLFSVNIADAIISQVMDNFTGIVRGVVITDHNFVVIEGLCQGTLQGVLQEVSTVASWHHNREKGHFAFSFYIDQTAQMDTPLPIF